jgi:hypothetical protein
VIVQTMPWVSIYVARVVNDDGRLVEDDNYHGIVQANFTIWNF